MKEQTIEIQTAKIETLKNGEYFRRLKKNGNEMNKEYRKEAFCRINKGYVGSDQDDISREIYLKKGTLVSIGFTY